MTVINQSTNAWVAGVHVPIGTTDFPVQGNLQIYTTGWGPSNVVCASSDTLFMYEEGYNLQPGYGLLEAWVLGFAIGITGFGTLGMGRRLARWLQQPGALENM